MREHVNPCLLVERIRYVCIGLLGFGNEAWAGHISLAHISLLGPEITSRLAKTKPSESESGFLLKRQQTYAVAWMVSPARRLCLFLSPARPPLFLSTGGGSGRGTR